MNTFAITGSAKPDIIFGSYCQELADILKLNGTNEVEIQNAKYVIFINHNRKVIKDLKSSTDRILIRLEPKAVFPAQYTEKIENLYTMIFTPGNIKNQKDFIGWPYKHHANPSKPKNEEVNLEDLLNELRQSDVFNIKSWKAKKNKIVMVAANKISPIRNTGYEIRRSFARDSSENALDIYGPYWHGDYPNRIKQLIAMFSFNLRNGTFINIKEVISGLSVNLKFAIGEIEDKHAVISQYRFNLVIENSDDYISEKIFDSMLNGSIPIYVGPDLNRIGIPRECFILLKTNTENLKSVIEDITDEEAEQRLSSMRSFILSDKFIENWKSENIYKKIALGIANSRSRNLYK